MSVSLWVWTWGYSAHRSQRCWSPWIQNYRRDCEPHDMGAGNQLRSSAKAVLTLNCWTITVAPSSTFSVIIFSDKSVFPFFATSSYGCFQNLLITKWSWWCILVFQLPRRLTQEDCGFKAGLGNMRTLSLKKGPWQRLGCLIFICGLLCFFLVFI